MSLPKRSAPCWSNPPFLINFLVFGHSGAQSWAPECPNVKKLKGWIGPVWPWTLWTVTIWHHKVKRVIIRTKKSWYLVYKTAEAVFIEGLNLAQVSVVFMIDRQLSCSQKIKSHSLCVIIWWLCCGVVAQRSTVCWPTTGTTGVSVAWGVVQASSDEFDAFCRLRSTAGDLVPATRSRKPSAKAPVARSLELLTDMMNSEVSLRHSLGLRLTTENGSMLVSM